MVLPPFPRWRELHAPQPLVRLFGGGLLGGIFLRQAALAERPAFADHPGVQVFAVDMADGQQAAMLIAVVAFAKDPFASHQVKEKTGGEPAA